MSKYRKRLPQLGNSLFVTDGGLETTLVFHEGRDLPCFAAFDLLKDDEGIATLRRYYDRYLELAREHGLGAILEAPTWRANPDWAAKVGYDAVSQDDANRKAIGLMLELRQAYETPATPMVISGNVGPRADGYRVEAQMSASDAQRYHSRQIETFAATDADFVSAFTINYTGEAVGIVNAAREARIPVVMSFTVETDGRLPSGEALGDAIRHTDDETGGYAAYYMLNCAHPTHFHGVLGSGDGWQSRIRGLRANASRLSHAELDECTELDRGNPDELGLQYRLLREQLPNLTVLGGCCGTDHQHVDAIIRVCGLAA
ncbi:MAG TPA: homocysteine S-methyltransferase family protein [Woeseiaceae bacterium]|nr:homocysteine S-methyltransferase family protein [Woeseiaceae bacterium]